MLSSSLLTLLAGAAVVAAQDYPEYPESSEAPIDYPVSSEAPVYPVYSTAEPTTTSTITYTATLTITKCNPAKGYCPPETTSSTSCTTNSTSYIYPIYNTTVAYPTKVYPTDVYVTKSSYVPVQPTKAPAQPTGVVESGASPLAQGGMLVAFVAAGLALLA